MKLTIKCFKVDITETESYDDYHSDDKLAEGKMKKMNSAAKVMMWKTESHVKGQT